jgi:hypothetical protein
MTDPVPSNIGHGHVFPRPDGVRARCGGPAMCRVCAADLARKNIQEAVKADPVPSKELIAAPENPTLEDLIAFYGDSNFRSGVKVRIPYAATRQVLEELRQMREDWKTISEAADAFPTAEPPASLGARIPPDIGLREHHPGECGSNPLPCTKPPEGWRCTREAGHDGPCAAIPSRAVNESLLRGLRQVTGHSSDEICHAAASEIERQQAQIATLKGYIERTALAGYRCAECAARLTAEPPAEWQPIETAPKDGTPILGYVLPPRMQASLQGPRVVKWIGEASMWSMPGISGLTCSHWMPLPAGPSQPSPAEPSAWLSCSKCDAKVELQVIDGYAQLTEAAMAWTCDTKNGWRCQTCSAQPPEDAQHAGGRIMTLRECMDAEDGGE